VEALRQVASLGEAAIRQDHLAPALQSARTVVRARTIHGEHVVVASTVVAGPVNAESVGPAAYFGTVATAVHGAPAEDAFDGSSVRYLVVDIAIALAGVLQTSVAVALLCTVIHAFGNSHFAIEVDASLEGTWSAIFAAANVFPALVSHIGELLLRRRDSWCVAWLLRSVIGAIRRRVATWQAVELACDWLVDRRGQSASLAFVTAVEVEKRAVLNISAVVGTLVRRLLQYVNVPPVNKVTVEAKASAVSLGEDEGVLVLIPPSVVEAVHRVDDFIEDADKPHWMGGWTRSVVVVTNGVRHV